MTSKTGCSSRDIALKIHLLNPLGVKKYNHLKCHLSYFSLQFQL